MDDLRQTIPYATPRRPARGWPKVWRQWFCDSDSSSSRLSHRDAIERAVRAAVRQLGATEKIVIECYFYDGLSHSRIGAQTGLSYDRVRQLHRQALTHLERLLTPFVRERFGIVPNRQSTCPICAAPWRTIAEDILDAKTPADSWGALAARIARATGFTVTTPQTLIGHQRNHRRLSREARAKSSIEEMFATTMEDS